MATVRAQAQEGKTAMTEESGGQLSKPMSWLEDVRGFWLGVQREIKQVSWPTVQPEVVNTTIIVILAVFFFAFYLFVMDIALSYLINGVEWVARKIFG